MLQILVPSAHLLDLLPHFRHEFIRRDNLHPAALAQEPHLDAVAVDLGLNQVAAAAPFDHLGRGQLVQHRLQRWPGKVKPHGAQCAGPHKEAPAAQHPFVKDGRWLRLGGRSMYHNPLDAIHTEVQRMALALIGAEGDEIEIEVRKHHRSGPQPMGDQGAIHAVVVNGNLALVGDAAHQLPQRGLDALTAVLDLRIVVELFADEVLHPGPILRRGESLELLGQSQQLLPGKRSGSDQHLRHGEKLLIAEKFLHDEMIPAGLMRVSQLRIAYQCPVIGQESLEIIDAAGDALGGNIIFLRQRLHRESFAPQSTKEQLQQPILS